MSKQSRFANFVTVNFIAEAREVGGAGMKFLRASQRVCEWIWQVRWNMLHSTFFHYRSSHQKMQIWALLSLEVIREVTSQTTGDKKKSSFILSKQACFNYCPLPKGLRWMMMFFLMCMYCMCVFGLSCVCLLLKYLVNCETLWEYSLDVPPSN